MGRPSIYGLVDPRDGAVRYLGKANNPAARFKGHLRDSRRRQTPVYCWMRKLAGMGLAPTLTVIEADCVDWRESERRLIAEARVRGDRLLNVADGGDEPHCPIEVRRANARRLNDSMDTLDGYRALVRVAGQIAHAARCRGRDDLAAALDGAMSKLRAMSHDEKVAAGQKWLTKHPKASR